MRFKNKIKLISNSKIGGRFLAALILSLIYSCPVSAQTYTWGAGATNDDWHGILNWTGGNVFDPVPDHVSEKAIMVDHGNHFPKLYYNVEIGDLTLEQQSYLGTNGKQLIVNTTTGRSGTTYIKSMATLNVLSPGFVDTDNLSVSGNLEIEGALVQVDSNATINSGGYISGYGRLQIASSSGSLSNNGYIVGEFGQRLRIFGNGSFDWDGAGGGVLKVHHDSELRIEIPHSDPFDGRLELDNGATFNPISPWELKTGIVDMRGGSILGGQLHVSNGAALLLATSSGNDFQCNLDADLLMSNGLLEVGQYCSLEMSGESVIQNPTLVRLLHDSTLFIAEGLIDGTVDGTGNLVKTSAAHVLLSGNLIHTGDTVIEDGELELTDLSGPLVCNGGTVRLQDLGVPTNFGSDLSQNVGSTIAVEIRSSADFDQFVVAGGVTLDGNIKISLDGYNPSLGDSFLVFDAAQVSGTPTFDFSDAQLANGLQWDTSQLGMLQVIEESLPLEFDPGLGVLNGIAFDSSTGLIYLHGTFDTTLEIYSEYGHHVGSIPDPGQNGNESDYSFNSLPTMIGGVPVPANSLIVIENESAVAQLIAADPATGAVFASQDLNFVAGQLVGGTFCDSTGTFYAIDWITDQIYEFDGSGNLLNLVDAVNNFDVFYGDIEFNPVDGYLYLVSSQHDFIQVLRPNGEYVGEIDVSSRIGGMSGISFNHVTGDAWISSIFGFAYRWEFVSYSVQPYSFSLTRGTLSAGNLEQLQFSDNNDVSIRRNGSDIQSRTEFEVELVAPLSNPSAMSATLEGSVFARSQITQSLEFYDWSSSAWETIDTRAANRLSDRTDTIDVTGDLSRFIELGTRRIRARIRFQSGNLREQFSSNTDLFSVEVTR